MLPNSITQAIKKKAEEKYHFDKSDYLTDDEADVKIKEQEAYTSGYLDAIEEVILFAEWKERNNYWADWGGFEQNLDPKILYWSNDSVNPQNLTTQELLTKYFETKQ